MLPQHSLPVRFGPYLIEGILGQGGFGVVYRARHEAMGHRVALKTLKLRSPALWGSLRREIQALARVHDPGIVAIFDNGIHEKTPWYAMALIEGETLRHWLQRRSQTPSTSHETLHTTLTIAVELARCLAVLHGLGLVHRDLKPENIILNTDGKPVLFDFGLAKRANLRWGRDHLVLAATGVGTFAYASPEQLSGEWCDARSDLYGFGCILMEMLTGEPMFDTNTRTHNQSPQRLRDRWPKAPKTLDHLVNTLLRENPRQRIGYAVDVMALLKEHLPQTASQPSLPETSFYPYRPRFVGRNVVFSALKRFLRQGLEQAHGNIVVIEGSSGIGKTRLMHELRRALHTKDTRVTAGTCASWTMGYAHNYALPLQPLQETLRMLVEDCTTFEPARVAQILGHNGARLIPFEPMLADITDVTPSSTEGFTARELAEQMCMALAQVLGNWSRYTQLVLLIDDIHQADPLTIQFLEHIIRSRCWKSFPIALVCTFCPSEAPDGLDTLFQHPQVRRLELTHLEPEAIHHMAADMLALEEAPAGLVEFLCEHTEGNPLWIAEYLRVAVEEQKLVRSPGSPWQLNPSKHGSWETSLGALDALVGRRLTSLSPSALHLAQLASLLGPSFPIHVLLDIDNKGHDRLELDELLRRNILERTSEGELAFVHRKLREVCYAQLSEEKRCQLHRQTAQHMAAKHHTRPAECAWHWEQASEWDKASPWYLKAALQSRDRYDYRSAFNLLQTYRNLPIPLRDKANEALLELARIAWTLGEFEQSEHYAIQLFDEAELSGDLQSKASALYIRGLCISHTRSIEQALPWLERARTQILMVEQPLEASRIIADLGHFCHMSGQTDNALSYFTEALSLLDENDSNRGALYVRCSGAYRRQGALEKAEEHLLKALELNHKTHPIKQGRRLQNLASLRMKQGRVLESIEVLEQAFATYQSSGYLVGVATICTNLAIRFITIGDWERAEDLLEQALAIHTDCDHHVNKATVHTNISFLHFLQGRLDDARTIALTALKEHEKTGYKLFEAITCLYLSRIESKAHNFDDAHHYIERLITTSHAKNLTDVYVTGLVQKALIMRKQGKYDEANILLEQIEADPRALSMVNVHFEATSQRLHLMLAQGQEPSGLLDVLDALREPFLMPESDFERIYAHAKRAMTLFKAGEPLKHGEDPELF